MSYKPKYCCQCAEKIERTNWRPWTSGRFCQLCDTEYGVSDWVWKGVFAFVFLTAIVGVGNFWRKPEKELLVQSNQLSRTAPNFKQNSNSQTPNSNSATVQPAAQAKENDAAAQSKPPQALAAAFRQSEKVKTIENQPGAPVPQEIVYFCGAQTKKGTPCTRRVKNGGRCWQHTGQPAMLPQEKLIANK